MIITTIIALQGNLRRSEGDEVRSLEGNIELILGRLGDLRNTGLIISYAGDRYNSRGWDDLDNYPKCILPNIIRSIMGIPCFTNESTAFTDKIGLTPGSWSSEPITIIGDAFSRFGLSGVILVAFIAGLLIYLNDFLIKKISEKAKYIYYALLCQLLFSVYSASLLNFLLITTRDALIIWILIVFYKNFTIKSIRY